MSLIQIAHLLPRLRLTTSAPAPIGRRRGAPADSDTTRTIFTYASDSATAFRRLVSTPVLLARMSMARWLAEAAHLATIAASAPAGARRGCRRATCRGRAPREFGA